MAEGWNDARRRLGAAQKGHARGSPAYSIYVNRKVGRLLAATAYVWGWTPNGVTAVSAVFTFTGIALIALVPPSPFLGVGIALLLAIGYAWDSADGQLARLRGGGTVSGEWLDHFVDSIKTVVLHLAVLIGFYRFTDLAVGWLLIPIAFSAVATVTFFGMLLNDLLKSARGIQSSAQRGGGSLLRSLMTLPIDYGLLCLVFVLWGWTPVFLFFYGAIFVLSTLFLFAASVRWFREMRGIDAARAS